MIGAFCILFAEVIHSALFLIFSFFLMYKYMDVLLHITSQINAYEIYLL